MDGHTVKNLNLETRFDPDLREIPVNPGDFKKAIATLEAQLKSESVSSETIKHLGQLGTLQRIIGLLDEAEKHFERAISLSSSLDEPKLKLASLIRLGNVKHWKKDFAEARRIFDECFEIVAKDKSFDEYLDFVYQHKGKCYFGQSRYEFALSQFYKAILIRNNKSEIDLADSTLLAIEETKRRWHGISYALIHRSVVLFFQMQF